MLVLNEMEQSSLAGKDPQERARIEELMKKKEARKQKGKTIGDDTQKQIVEELTQGRILQFSPTMQRASPSPATEAPPRNPIPAALPPSLTPAPVGMEEKPQSDHSPQTPSPSSKGAASPTPPPPTTALSPSPSIDSSRTPPASPMKPPPSPRISMHNTFIDVDAEGT